MSNYLREIPGKIAACPGCFLPGMFKVDDEYLILLNKPG